MADFFSRIAERTLGMAPVVRPNVPPMFAPSPPVETSAEVFAPPRLEMKNDSPARQDSRRDYPDPEIAENPPAFARDQSTRTTLAEREISASRTQAKLEASVQRPPISRINSRESNPMVSAPAGPMTAYGDARPPDSESARSVQVTIGRIEVRTVTAPPPEPRSIEKKPVRLSSLEEYLTERNGRRR